MRRLTVPLVGCMISAIITQGAVAQPRPYSDAWRPQAQYRDAGYRDAGPRQNAGHGDRYYYNGRWVDSREWQRHSSERDRWANDYHRRRGDRDNNDSSAVIAGILGFALGAAIVGSAQQAQHARTANASWDDYCARKYRSYDRRSRTYFGNDGLRHYCQ